MRKAFPCRFPLAWVAACALVGCAAATPLEGPRALAAAPAPGAASWLPRALEPKAPSPAPSPVAPPTPAVPAPFPSLRPSPWPPAGPRPAIAGLDLSHTLIPFASNRGTDSGRHDFDIYLYDRTRETVLVPPGANTPADEFEAALSNNNHWLVYTTRIHGDADVWLYDMVTGLVDPLPVANSPGEERSPSVTAAGDVIAYTSEEHGIDRLHLYNLRTDANLVPAVVERLGTRISSPTISPDGTRVAFSTPVAGRGLDIMIYAIPTATLWSPPFVNSPFDEDEPVLSPDNRRVVFTTTRNGNKDVMLGDFTTGQVDPLPLANTPCDELTPSFLGTKGDQVLFLSDRTGKGDRRFYIYALGPHVLDTLPVSHVVGRFDTFSPP